MVELLVHADTQKALASFKNSPTHAVLLAGHSGLGKSLVAQTLIGELLNIPPDELKNYAYYRTIEPEKGSISIEKIRELNAFFARKVPGTKQFARFVIIKNVDQLTLEASNALLKLLEEPPVDSIFILTSSKLNKVLPTIRSRTRIVVVATPDKDQVVQYFSRLGHDPTVVERAWLMSGTSISKTTEALLDSTVSDDVLSLVKRVLAADAFERLILADKLAKDKSEATDFVQALAHTAEASLLQAAQKNTNAAARWHQILSAANTAHQALTGNTSAKLVLTELMLAL
ncbi:MAG: AAA family ATPase [Candidatus Saccharimonadales bacterium]